MVLSKQTIDNLEQYTVHYAQKGWVRIENYLAQDTAEQFHQQVVKLAQNTQDWHMATLVEGKAFIAKVNDYLGQPPQERSLFIAQLLRYAQQNDFQYFYEFIRLLGGNASPSEALTELTKTIGSTQNVDILKQVVGDPSIEQIDAQLTCYKPGHFLKHHCDEGFQSPRQRKVAYVLGLSKDWQPDWGGLLHFQNGQGKIIESLIPTFNCITLFTVPTPHFVSQVTNYCPQPRFSVTGWLWE